MPNIEQIGAMPNTEQTGAMPNTQFSFLMSGIWYKVFVYHVTWVAWHAVDIITFLHFQKIIDQFQIFSGYCYCFVLIVVFSFNVTLLYCFYTTDHVAWLALLCLRCFACVALQQPIPPYDLWSRQVFPVFVCATGTWLFGMSENYSLGLHYIITILWCSVIDL